MKILCVEHHAAYLNALQRMLEKSGHNVTAASTARQGFLLFSAQSFDGVLLERDLPDRTSSAVREDMKRMRPEVPVLLFAGVGRQTPMLLEFFDAYIGHERPPNNSVRNNRVA
jgi:DNA-binding response OmpR family regulator